MFTEIKKEFKRLPSFVRELKPLSDDLTYYAASLSFYTLFALTPLLWILFSVFSELSVFSDYYLQMKALLMSFIVPGQSEQVLMHFEHFLANSSHMGWLGLVYVVFTSILFFANYSDVVNRIFHVPNRRLWRSMFGFISVMLLAPFLLGVSLFLSSQLPVYLNISNKVTWLNALYSYILLCVLFFSVYKFSPNTYVGSMAAFIAAIVTAALWQATKMAFLYYIVINQAYSTIYGSFSMLLFTLLWIYLSWVLCLYGLKLCYYLHYHQTHRLGNAK